MSSMKSSHQRVPVRRRDRGGDHREVQHEVDDPGQRHDRQRSARHRRTGERARAQAGQPQDQRGQRRGRPTYWPVLKTIRHSCLRLAISPSSDAGAVHQQRRPRSPVEEDREDERGRDRDALRVVRPGGDDRAQLGDQHQAGDQRERRPQRDGLVAASAGSPPGRAGARRAGRRRRSRPRTTSRRRHRRQAGGSRCAGSATVPPCRAGPSRHPRTVSCVLSALPGRFL